MTWKAVVTTGIIFAALTMPASAQTYGGCLNGGKVCAGPSVALTVGQFNLSTSKFSAGIMPGVGYGVTLEPQRWYATGLALYLAAQIGQGQPNAVTPSLILSFANYVRLGVGASVRETDGPMQAQWLLLFGLGSDWPGGTSLTSNRTRHGG